MLNGDVLACVLRPTAAISDRRAVAHVVALAGVCRAFREAATSEPLWRHLCMLRWPSTVSLPSRGGVSYRAFYRRRALAVRQPQRRSLHSLWFLLEVRRPGVAVAAVSRAFCLGDARRVGRAGGDLRWSAPGLALPTAWHWGACALWDDVESQCYRFGDWTHRRRGPRGWDALYEEEDDDDDDDDGWEDMYGEAAGAEAEAGGEDVEDDGGDSLDEFIVDDDEDEEEDDEDEDGDDEEEGDDEGGGEGGGEEGGGEEEGDDDDDDDDDENDEDDEDDGRERRAHRFFARLEGDWEPRANLCVDLTPSSPEVTLSFERGGDAVGGSVLRKLLAGLRWA